MSASQIDLLIVGASARAAAGSARRAGLRVATCDLFADGDLAACAQATRIGRYPAGLKPWIEQQAAVPWIYTGALENHPGLIEQLAALRPLLGTSADAVRAARDPQGWCRPPLRRTGRRSLAARRS